MNQVSRPNLSAVGHDSRPQTEAVRTRTELTFACQLCIECHQVRRATPTRKCVIRAWHADMMQWPCVKHVRLRGATIWSSKVCKNTRAPAVRWQVLATCTWSHIRTCVRHVFVQFCLWQVTRVCVYQCAKHTTHCNDAWVWHTTSASIECNDMMNSPRPKVASEIWSVIWPKNWGHLSVHANTFSISERTCGGRELV